MQDFSFVFCEVVRRYAEPHRRYHTLDHIMFMLSKGFEVGGLSMEQMLAIWFHDVIYDPKAMTGVNESDSAAFAEQYLGDAWLGNLVAVIIRDTMNHTPTVPESELVLDLDLYEFSLPWKEYERNTQLIREEYSHVAEKDWEKGRLEFLEKMLKRDPFYYVLKDRTEKARENIEAEIAGLQAVRSMG